MPHKYTLLLIIVGVIVLCDQVTKLYIDAVRTTSTSLMCAIPAVPLGYSLGPTVGLYDRSY